MLSNVEVFILEHNTMTNFREASDTEVILILHVNPCFISCLVLPLSFLDTWKTTGSREYIILIYLWYCYNFKHVLTGYYINVNSESVSTYSARLLLEFGCLFGVGHCSLYKAHRLVHVALNSVNHTTLEDGRTRWNKAREENNYHWSYWQHAFEQQQSCCWNLFLKISNTTTCIMLYYVCSIEQTLFAWFQKVPNKKATYSNHLFSSNLEAHIFTNRCKRIALKDAVNAVL